jgi:hypothetical protein
MFASPYLGPLVIMVGREKKERRKNENFFID